MKKICVLLLLASFGASYIAGAQGDKVLTLSEQEVADIVRQFHPVIQQASLRIEQAAADITAARGNFDPLLQTGVAEKVFDGKQYYYYSQPELKIPTWYGIELHAGAAYVSGTRTNPEATLGNSSYAGISVPLLRNLLMDKRRAALQQAKIIRRQTTAEQQLVVNDVLRDALNSYWTWQQQYAVKKIIDQVVSTNEKRFELIKTAFRLGDRPAIDTVEAQTQLQALQAAQQQAHLELQNATIELSLYLWQQNNEPYYLPEEVQPTAEIITNPMAVQDVNAFIAATVSMHPALLQYRYHLDVASVEQKLKFQELLPQLNIKYNALHPGYNMIKTPSTPLLHNNYQYGLSFSMPLRLSAGRGAYKKAKLDVAKTQLEILVMQQEIENKIKTTYNQLQALQSQLALQKTALNNYIVLLRAEETRFFSGESSLFLINSRENKVLEAHQKVLELQTKWKQTHISLLWAGGVLSNAYQE